MAKEIPSNKKELVETVTPAVRVKRGCFYCGEKKSPTYTDTVTLKRFMSDRGKIVPKQRSGACAKHQRRIAVEVKRARHLALLPFTVKV